MTGIAAVRIVTPVVRANPAHGRRPDEQRPGRVPIQGAPAGCERIA